MACFNELTIALLKSLLSVNPWAYGPTIGKLAGHQMKSARVISSIDIKFENDVITQSLKMLSSFIIFSYIINFVDHIHYR